MSRKDIEMFYNKLNSDENLKKEVINIESRKDLSQDEMINDIIKLAKRNGFDFTYQEIKEYNTISDDFLENVSGGFTLCIGGLGGGDKCGCTAVGYGKGGCFCPLFGSGAWDI